MSEWHSKNKEWLKMYRKIYYRKHRKKKIAESLKRYYDNREEIIAKTKDRRKLKIEEVRAYNREYIRKKREAEAIRFIKRRQIERAYKEKRKEISERRKAEGYYRTEKYRAWARDYYKRTFGKDTKRSLSPST